MKTRTGPGFLGVLVLTCALTPLPCTLASEAARTGLWVDALRGEPMELTDMFDDLGQARVVYLGEYHTIAQHHELELEVLRGLSGQGTQLVLAMEQFEFDAQPVLDRFNRRTIDLETLVQETSLAKRWPGYTNYLALLSFARERDIPVLALNARTETIRAIARAGLDHLAPEMRQELPITLVTDDPVYERLLNRTLSVHMAFDPKKLRPIYEAQVARDETMAQRLYDFLTSPAGRNRTALVICGQGHCEFGLGIPGRVERRDPKIIQRILLFSESGDLQLTAEERKQAREVEISHQFLKDLGRAPADYFHVLTENPKPELRSR